MKRLAIIVLVLLAGIFFVSFVSAQGGSTNPNFVGLWEGVDVNDGSRRTVSISDNDRDGVFELSQYDTFWTLCGDDRGLTAGSATVGADGILHFVGTLTCLSTGQTVPFAVDYQIFQFSDTLLEIPQGVPLQPDTLHRVSSR